MRLNRQLPSRSDTDRDPREGHTAEVIDLATRNVLPQVTQRRGGRDGLGLAAGVGIVALLGAVTLWTMDTARTARNPLPAPGATLPRGAVTPLGPPVPPRALTPAPVGVPLPPPATVLAMPPQLMTQPMANPFAVPTVVFDASALPASLGPVAIPAPAAGGPAVAPGNGNDDFAARLGVGGLGASGSATARAMVDPRSTVTQGTLIPAVLETAIDTDVPGFVRAVVSADVRSFDGARVLVPRSSRLIGQYKSGLQAGQKRVYVIWTRLIRPDGVSVDIASPAVAFSGETGLPGQVNSHFFERFGSAMLLSVVGGLSAIGSGGATIIAGSGQSAAAAAIGQTGQIGPTVRVRQGEPIRVFTARDLDFSKVVTQ